MPWLVRFLVMRFGMRVVRWGWQRYQSRSASTSTMQNQAAQNQATQNQVTQGPNAPPQGYGNQPPYQAPYQGQYNPQNPQGYDNRYGPPR